MDDADADDGDDNDDDDNHDDNDISDDVDDGKCERIGCQDEVEKNHNTFCIRR